MSLIAQQTKNAFLMQLYVALSVLVDAIPGARSSVELVRAQFVTLQFRYGSQGGGVDMAIEILIMVAVIPVAIAAWLLVDSTGWGTGPIALWNVGILLIVAAMIYRIWASAHA